MKLRLFLSMFVFLGIMCQPATVAQATVPGGYQGNLNLIVLIGQSNMSGYAPMPVNRPIDPMAWNIGDDYRWRPVQEPNDHQSNYAVDMVNYDSNAQYGPTLAFTLHLHHYDCDYPVGVVTCAKGASSILDWQESLSDETLYGACMKRIAAAQRFGQVVGVIMFQGEYESFPGRQAQAQTWAANFTQLVSDFREEQDVPFVFAQLGGYADFQLYPYWNIVKTQQASVSITDVSMIITDDLATLSDGVHFTPQSYNKIGCRFADALSIFLGIGDGLLPCVF